MSPLSVAQYLPLNKVKYDLVIFDEASQILVWDAIGTIARGKQLIVVGDPKQLPPTNFFKRTDDDDEENDEDEILDTESILNECRAAHIQEIHLKWHYRSRHESLIAFSNHHYYENSLYTFPSARQNVEGLGVKFRYVPDGCFDSGKSRTNKVEAEQLVNAVVERLRDPDFTNKSLGIVTFNEAQQQLIDDLLEEKRQEFPEIEPFFDSERSEPVFVKNLENVQGDERDVMYFSIGYGRTADGRISMNFGPLNKDGGERRLNVAVTRAKEENLVFSSMKSGDIDLSRTQKTGPEHLKYFLEYAENGGKTVQTKATSVPANDTFDSCFEEDVAAFLREHGYTVHTQVGCSKYRIDLAIAAPDKPGEFIVGIECDGATYHSSATARDRDLLRQTILEGLGWKILRVWSTDWFTNREGAEETLLRGVEEIMQRRRNQ